MKATHHTLHSNNTSVFHRMRVAGAFDLFRLSPFCMHLGSRASCSRNPCSAPTELKKLNTSASDAANTDHVLSPSAGDCWYHIPSPSKQKLKQVSVGRTSVLTVDENGKVFNYLIYQLLDGHILIMILIILFPAQVTCGTGRVWPPATLRAPPGNTSLIMCARSP